MLVRVELADCWLGGGGRGRITVAATRTPHFAHFPRNSHFWLCFACVFFFIHIFFIYFFLPAQIFRTFCRLRHVVVAAVFHFFFVECFGHRQKQKAHTLNYENKMRCDAMGCDAMRNLDAPLSYPSKGRRHAKPLNNSTQLDSTRR